MFLTILTASSFITQFGQLAEIVLGIGAIVGVVIVAVGFFKSRGRDNALTVANQNVDAYKEQVAAINGNYALLEGKYNILQKAHEDSLAQIAVLTAKVKDLSDMISGTKAIEALTEVIDSHHGDVMTILEKLEGR